MRNGELGLFGGRPVQRAHMFSLEKFHLTVLLQSTYITSKALFH